MANPWTCSIGKVLALLCWLTKRCQHVQVLVQVEADSNLFTYVSTEVIVTTRNHKYQTWTDIWTSSDIRLEWPGEGPLFESDSNKRWGTKTGPLFESPPRPLLKSDLQPLGRYGTHQETIGVWDMNRCILYLTTQDWNGLGRSHYSSRTQINAGGPIRGHYSSHLVVEVRPGSSWAYMAPTRNP